MTTHCAARYQKILKKIKPRICIVEEAAEVCTFLSIFDEDIYQNIDTSLIRFRA
jgi:hypothetical protein